MKGSDLRESFRRWLVSACGGCDVQTGYVDGKKNEDGGWPCGTCFIELLHQLGLDSKQLEYSDHNQEIDRCNEVWRAVLQIRDAKLEEVGE